ncbi:protein-glutamate methylesterase/protein-glutamine glutaminase [Fusibacter sp. JL216-2]|uniref:protein-glutamate methylesterase/protein-glutamine glutaminase n=1 Tax=Fusibacter sp. JL216-2 TaxID=3071453 RepID=UPI003D34B3AC
MNKDSQKKVRVLVVDDSALFRNQLKKALESDGNIEVVGMAADPYEARDIILKLHPDVMTLDVNMPKMNGIDFLKKLMPQYPMPVVVVSSANGIVFDAIQAGAVDFVEKPSRAQASVVEAMISELIMKVKVASKSNVIRKRKRKITQGRVSKAPLTTATDKVIAIGASTGGTEAIFEVIKKFPSDCAPTVIVQHMPAVFTKLYAERMNQSCQVSVKEAMDGDWVEKGTVLIAPGEHHMTLKKNGNKFQVKLSRSEKVNGHRPSVDVMFDSVAECVGKKAVGVILTGMGKDGAQGLLNMRRGGARTIGQDPGTCVVYGMPKAAFEIGAVEYQLPLPDITDQIIKLLAD